MELEYNTASMRNRTTFHSHIYRIFFLIALGGSFFSFYRINTGNIYTEYESLWDYRRLHPEFQPQEKTVRIFDAGHTTTYADMLWVNLIQYIADNIGNGMYVDYAPPLLDTISRLHPHFTRSYTLALLLTPSLDPNSISFATKNIGIGEKTFEIGLRGIQENCDEKKVSEVLSGWVALHPWNRSDLHNSCTDGFIPYYLAFVADGLGKRDLASRYYALASTNDDAPKASQYLSIIMHGKSGNRRDAALQFFLIWSSGYDEAPYTCRQNSTDIIQLLLKKESLTEWDIDKIKNIEAHLTEPQDSDNPLAKSITNCYESTNRGIKQSYLAYITEHSMAHPEVITGSWLIDQHIIKSIPFPKGYTHYTIERLDWWDWEYRHIIP